VAGTRESSLSKQPSVRPLLDLELYERYGLGIQGPTEKQRQDLIGWCSEDPKNFIFGGFVRTFDEHDRKNPIKPFPDRDYLRHTLDFIHGGDSETDAAVRCVSKSRQLSLTWLVCAYAIWEARFHEHRRVMIQSKKAEDAYRLVFWKHWLSSRCSFMERALPPWMWLESEGRGTVGTKGEVSYPNGSVIMGIPEGGHQFRSYVASLVIMDEACFMPEFEDSYTAALAMSKGGGRIIAVTTAAQGTYYAKLVEEEEMSLQEEAAA
jgi:hypothetical protein